SPASYPPTFLERPVPAPSDYSSGIPAGANSALAQHRDATPSGSMRRRRAILKSPCHRGNIDRPMILWSVLISAAHSSEAGMSEVTSTRRVRITQRTPYYWRITFDHPHLNILGPERTRQ